MLDRESAGKGVDPAGRSLPPRTESARVFLVHSADGSTDHYESILEELGHQVVLWKSVSDALQHLAEYSPDLLILNEIYGKPVQQALGEHAFLGTLLPDVMFLESQEKGVAEPHLRMETSFWSMPLEFLGGASWSASPPGFAGRSLVHPADPQEFESAVSHVLSGRRLRNSHFRMQAQRQLYRRCTSLVLARSAGALCVQGLEAAVEVTGVPAGAVVDWMATQEMEVKCCVGQGPQLLQRIVGLGLRWERPVDSRWRWFRLPELLSRSAQRALAGHVLVVPLQNRDADVLLLALMTGQRSALQPDMKEDLELVVDHIKLGLERVGDGAVPVQNRLRDPWTGLLNREGILRAVGRVLRKGRLPVSLLVVDIDEFTRHNDRMGHLVGGALLRACAGRLFGHAERFRWAGRIGPDEFAVVLPDCAWDEALRIGRSIVGAVETVPFPLPESDGTVDLTVTVGVATASTAPWSAQRLLERGFEALSVGKKSGGNRVQVLQERPAGAPVDPTG